MKYILPLAESSGARAVGGKAFNLSQLASGGFKVPGGFVVAAKAFNEALCAELGEFRAAGPGEAASLLPKLRERALGAVLTGGLGRELGEAWASLNARAAAVRSSAPAEDGEISSFAGQFESFLGVKAAGLEEAVKRCWASAFNRRAHAYGAGFAPGMAVVVQQLVEAEVSGVAFSCDPVTGDRNSVVIEAVYGLCEPLVSGSITPDHYLVEKAGLAVKESRIAVQEEYLGVNPEGGTALFPVREELRARPKLTPETLKLVTAAAVGAERLFARPADIEWALKGGELYLLQARPVTGLEDIK